MQISKAAHSSMEKIELVHLAGLFLLFCYQLCQQIHSALSTAAALKAAILRTILPLIALTWFMAGYPSSLKAQIRAEPPANIRIMDVETANPDHVSISVFSSDLPMDMLRLPTQIIELSGPSRNVVQEFQTYPDYIGSQRILIVNTEKLDRVGMGGRSHRANIESIMREIYDHPTVFSNIDWMSAYALVRDSDATKIAEWNQDKGNYFIDLVTFDFEGIQNRPLQTATPVQVILDAIQQGSDSESGSEELSLTVGLDSAQIPEGAKPQGSEDLSSVFQRFNNLPPDSLAVKSVIIFTDSAEQIFSSTGRSTLESLTRYALQNQIYVHAVHLAHESTHESAQESVPANTELQRLVTDTGGVHVHYQSQNDLLPLWTRLNEEKQRTKLVYQPSGSHVESIRVRVTLPDGKRATSQDFGVEFPAREEPVDENTALYSSANETDASSTNGTILTQPLPTVLTGEGSSTSWLASLLGLSTESTTLEKGTLLILWALSLGLLFFLIFPEIARGWRLSSRIGRRFLTPIRRLLTPLTVEPLSSDHPLVSSFPSPGQNGNLLNGYSSTGHVANGHAASGHPANGHAVNGHAAGEPLSNKNGNGVADAHYRKGDYSEEDGDATEIQYPVILGDIGRLLRITYDAGLPEEVPIRQVSQSDTDEVAMYIGRDHRRNTIIIPDSTKRISREHAVLILERGLLYLADNSSIGGTFLNRVRLGPSDRKLLRDGDRIGLGGVEYQIQLQSEEATVVNLQEP